MIRRLFNALVLATAALLSGCMIPPPDQAYAGSTKQQIIAELGQPTTQFKGHYGLVPKWWVDAHPDCVTYEYERLNGTLYITVERRDAAWVGLCSQWLPAGGVF